MKQISIRDLKAGLSAAIAEAEAGQTINRSIADARKKLSL
jgi:antitoxin (DNA-binding transcriptional repressor) of toxin-antitoxin stability system